MCDHVVYDHHLIWTSLTWFLWSSNARTFRIMHMIVHCGVSAGRVWSCNVLCINRVQCTIMQCMMTPCFTPIVFRLNGWISHSLIRVGIKCTIPWSQLMELITYTTHTILAYWTCHQVLSQIRIGPFKSLCIVVRFCVIFMSLLHLQPYVLKRPLLLLTFFSY